MDPHKSNKDPLKGTKIVGTLCAAGLVFLFGQWGAEALTSRGMPAEHHGEEGHDEPMQAYVIEVADAGGAGAEAKGPDFGALMHEADPAKGEKVFSKCKACHSMELGKNGTGPSLGDVVGRMAGTEPGFKYSDAMANHGQVWTPEHLFTYLGDVKGTVPGTTMSFNGIPNVEQRADLIAYLMGDQFNPDDFSASAEPEAAEGGEAAANDAGEVAAAPIAGDAAKGEKVFNKCKACHSPEPGKNGTGPTLFGVVGRAVGSVEGFKYSEAMKTHGGNWTPELLDQYLADVKGTIPGNKMSFAGLKKEQDRADIIAYLETLK